MKIFAVSDIWGPCIMDAEELVGNFTDRQSGPCWDRRNYQTPDGWACDVFNTLTHNGFYHGYLESDAEALHVIMIDLRKIAEGIEQYQINEAVRNFTKMVEARILEDAQTTFPECPKEFK